MTSTNTLHPPSPRQVGRRRRRPRRINPTTVLLVLVAAHVMLKLVLLPIALRTPLQGDEGAYNAGGQALADAVRSFLGGGDVSWTSLQETVVDRGWFMPGVSLAVAPLYLVAPDAGLEAVRLYIGALTLALFLLGAWAIARVAGRRYAAGLLVFPGLVPLWVLYSYSSWGDTLAGLVVVLLVAVLVRLWRRLDDGHAIRLRDGALVGFLLASTLYLRSSVLPLVLVVLLLSIITVACRTRGRSLGRSLAGWAVAAATFAALLFPWSQAVSDAFGERVTTTTTVPISMAYAFGDRNELCLGPCREGNPWYAMTDYATEVAQRTGQTPLAVQREMADHALRDMTPGSYAADVLDNFGRYVLQPSGFEAIFRVAKDGDHLRPDPPGRVSEAIVRTTNIMYFTVLVLAAAGILLVRRVPRVPQVVALLAATLGGALMSQPFVHIASPRYWPVFAPLMALAAVGLLVRSDRSASSTWLRRLQILVAVGWVTVFVGLIVVAD